VNVTRRNGTAMILLILIVVSLQTACNQESGTGNNQSAPQTLSTGAQNSASLSRTLALRSVISKQLASEVKLPSDLIAYRDVAIFPKVPGFIEWIGVDRGSKVKKGQLLIRMTAPELPAQTKQGLDAATAAKNETIQMKDELNVVKEQLAAAQAKAKASSDTYRRLKEASAYPGIIAGNDLEIAEKTAEGDAATVRSLERKCKSLQSQEQSAEKKQQAALQSAMSSKAVESYLRLSAPFDGTITERSVHEGSFVNPPSNSNSQPLLRLKQSSILRLVVPVPEADVGGILPGARVRFTVSAFPAEYFSGEVKRVSESVDINTRTMAVELDVPNADHRLDSGMFADVLWPMRRKQPTLFVPQSAVVKTTERTFVIRVKHGEAEWVDVKTGVTDGETIEVFGNLSAGDQVVVRGTDEIRPGTKVNGSS